MIVPMYLDPSAFDTLFQFDFLYLAHFQTVLYKVYTLDLIRYRGEAGQSLES